MEVWSVLSVSSALLPTTSAIPQEDKKRPGERTCQRTGGVRFIVWVGVSSPSQLCCVSWGLDTFHPMAF